MIAAPTQRLFFALWPPPEIAAALHRVAAEITGGRAMREETLHITLDFIGSVPASLLPTIEAAAASVCASAFLLRIDRLDHFRRKNIVWAGCSETPAALAALARDLKTARRTLDGPEPDPRFVAHLTLLRKAPAAPVLPSMPAIEWTVRDFRLMRSEPCASGVNYVEIRRWPLDL